MPSSSMSLLSKCYCCSSKQAAAAAESKPICTVTHHFRLNSSCCCNYSCSCSCMHACTCNSAGSARLLTRRAHVISILAIGGGVSARPAHVHAEEKDGGGVVGAIKSILDPNEKTKAGKVLPKAYLKAARGVVKTLRESLEEDGGDVAKFRRSADAAKESIREFLGGWRGQQAVAAEESYVALERAIRSLAEFYSKAGPFAKLSEEVKSKILDDLNTADASL